MNSNVIKISLFVFAAVAVLAIINIKCTPSVGQEIPAVVDYNFHVRPILSDRCFACHGPDEKKREANLRLDTEEGAYAALEDNPKAHAIVKGNPEESEVYKRIISTDTSIKMPPPSSNLTITEDEIKIIKKWISQGAKIKKHWAFLPPLKSPLPKADKDWVKMR